MISSLQDSRRGAASKVLLLFVASVLVVLGLAYLALTLRPDAQRNSNSQAIVRVYCASGLVKPVEQVIEEYNSRFGTRIEIARTGGSGELAGQIKTEFETGVDGGADLYITADADLLAKARTEGIVLERFPLAVQRPVIAISANSQLAFKDLSDLVGRDDVKFGIASENAAVGKLTRRIAARDGVLKQLESKKATDSENVMTLAQALVTGSLDAAVIWDTTVALVNQQGADNGVALLKIAAKADSNNEHQSNIAIGVVATADVPTECLKFARFLTAAETGKSAFDAVGFAFIEGDPWEEVPEIHLYCGSMFTPVLEEAVRKFASREGVNIYPRWEGCGKLVASMKSVDDTDLFPDAYLACDLMFLDEVQDHFETPKTISSNQIVIAVRRELDVSIDKAADLLTTNLRIGICDPLQSALGRLTKQMLTRSPYEDFYDQLELKAAVTVDVGPTLMSQLLAGGLDAAFVYRSNVLASPGSIDKIRIIEMDEGASKASAIQPWAVSRTTGNPQMMERFFEWISRPIIRERFRKQGFELFPQ